MVAFKYLTWLNACMDVIMYLSNSFNLIEIYKNKMKLNDTYNNYVKSVNFAVRRHKFSIKQ